MELQNYISENSDYDKTLKENGFVVKNFNKYNLKLIKYPYDKNINTNTFEKYLKDNGQVLRCGNVTDLNCYSTKEMK